jgi:hypothetical protein
MGKKSSLVIAPSLLAIHARETSNYNVDIDRRRITRSLLTAASLLLLL